MPRTYLMPQAAAAIGVWLACLVLIGMQWHSAINRCTRLWRTLQSPQRQAVAHGATPGLQIQMRTLTHPEHQQIVAVAVDAAGCIRYAGTQARLFASAAESRADSARKRPQARRVWQHDPGPIERWAQMEILQRRRAPQPVSRLKPGHERSRPRSAPFSEAGDRDGYGHAGGRAGWGRSRSDGLRCDLATLRTKWAS